MALAMFVDTSVMVCIAIGEADADRYVRALCMATTKLLPAPAYLECAMVLHGRLGALSTVRLADVLGLAEITIEPFSTNMAALAIQAFHTYGKGRHKAGLNFGDCLVYGAAKELGFPLLYKGEDFVQTGIASVFNQSHY